MSGANPRLFLGAPFGAFWVALAPARRHPIDKATDGRQDLAAGVAATASLR